MCIIPVSQFISLPLPPPYHNHKFVFYICDYFWVVNRFICNIFLDCTYKLYCMMFFPDLLSRQSLGPWVLVQMTLFHYFFYGWIIFHVYMYYIFFIHSSVDGHLGCFHVLAIVYYTAMNIRVCVSIFLNYGFLQIYAQEWDCGIIW